MVTDREEHSHLFAILKTIFIICRVEKGGSLYNGIPRNFLQTWTDLDIYYCTCSNKEPTCGFTQGSAQQPCVDADNDPIDDVLESCRARSIHRNKRDTPVHYFDDDVEGDVGDFSFTGSPPLTPVSLYYKFVKWWPMLIKINLEGPNTLKYLKQMKSLILAVRCHLETFDFINFWHMPIMKCI